MVIKEMIERLELTKCADTPVGNEDIRGISGGEKKRTSIGCELIVNPVVLFVDEPTSGLDSKMARSVVEHLKVLAEVERRTVITIIHQPSWRIFSLFDALVLLKDGRVVYQGPAIKVQVSLYICSSLPTGLVTSLDGNLGLFREHWFQPTSE